MAPNKKNPEIKELQSLVNSLHETLSDQQHYIDSVHETTIGLIQHSNVDDLLEKILTKAGILAGTPDRFLYLYDPHGDELIMKLGQGVYAEFLGTRIKPNKGLGGKVYTNGKPILIDDYSTWSKRIQHPIYDKLHSALGIPLKSKTLTIGVIGLGSFDSAKPFGANDLHKMNRFAELASIALENARLNTDLQNELNERKLAEKTLIESRERTELALMGANLGMWDYTIKTEAWNLDGRSIKMLGANPKSDAEFNELLHPDDIKKYHDTWNELEEDAKSFYVSEYRIKMPSGQYKWFKDKGKIVERDSSGKPVRIAGTIQDITIQKQAEKEIIQNEKMMSVGGLAAGMAHEINNPLAGIMQNAQVIKNRLTSSIPANDKAALESETTISSIKKYMKKRKILSSLDNILDAGSNAAKIVDNMLSFARKGDSSKTKCNIFQLLEKTLELAQSDYDLKKKYDFKQIGVIKEFDSAIPDVPCEESKIMQVFFNIIKNATESMYEVEEKTKTPTFIFRLKNLKGMVQIEIEDNGPGMSEDVRNRIFEPFFTTKDVKKGTGLGLSLSYFIIIEDHQGEMEVESTLGKGSKFIIRLPLF